jgi:hypothetical protein
VIAYRLLFAAGTSAAWGFAWGFAEHKGWAPHDAAVAIVVAGVAIIVALAFYAGE